MIRQLADAALLERIKVGVEAAKNWDASVFPAFARRDFDAALAPWPEAQEFAVAVAELTGRAEDIDHDVREGLLAAIHPIPEQLKAAKAFFVRFAPEIDRIRELEMYWKKSEAARQRDKQFQVARITITCFEKDVEKIREFARSVNAESKFGEIVPHRPRGRPPKPGSEAAKRRAELEWLMGKSKAGAPDDDEVLEPSEADIAAATKPMSAPASDSAPPSGVDAPSRETGSDRSGDMER